MGQRDEMINFIKEIKSQFDHAWVPCPICISSLNDDLGSTQQIRIVKRKSNLNKKVFEVKYSKIHVADIDQTGSSLSSGAGGLIVKRFKEDYIFQGFGEVDPNIGEMFSNLI